MNRLWNNRDRSCDFEFENDSDDEYYLQQERTEEDLKIPQKYLEKWEKLPKKYRYVSLLSNEKDDEDYLQQKRNEIDKLLWIKGLKSVRKIFNSKK